MKYSFGNIFFAFASTTLAVIMDPSAHNEKHQVPPELSSDPRTFSEALQTCFAKRSYGTLECVSRGALTALQSWNDEECLDFGDIKLERNQGESRNILDLDWDPKDFGNVMKAASRLLERRNMKWDLGNIYPGLQMRVGPTLSAGSGMLEFVMDERSSNHYHNRQVGTGRLLMRQLVLPFLLGFKFNLASLLPLLFGVLIIITKKALLLTKVALFIAGLLGWNSLFTGFQSSPHYVPNGANGFNTYNGYGYGSNPQVSNIEDNLGATILQDSNYQIQPFRKTAENLASPFGQHIIREIVNVYDTATSREDEESDRRKKNFIWTRNES